MESRQRPGDNLYSDSVVALDADTGELAWHFQFTPNDGYDFDSVQVPVLVDMDWNGAPAKLMLWANRNGFFYVLDRVTGQFLLGKPFVKVNWASSLDAARAPHPDAPAAWPAHVARQSGGHQLVSALVQPADRPLLLCRLGELRNDLQKGRGGVSARPHLPRRWLQSLDGGALRPDDWDRPQQPDHALVTFALRE